MFIHKVISQKAARDLIGSPEEFSGGVIVTKNGEPTIFMQPASERISEQEQLQMERESIALAQLVMLSRNDVSNGRTVSGREMLDRLRHKYETNQHVKEPRST